MGVYKLSASGGLAGARTTYASMLAGNPPTLPPSVVTGGVLSSDDLYFYRTFTASSNLEISVSPLTADLLVISGGGGGSGTGGIGGAGGGGAITFLSNQSLSTGTRTVTIGAGGASSTGTDGAGAPGSPSSIGSFTASAQNGAKPLPPNLSGPGGDSLMVINGIQTTRTGGANGTSVAPNRAGGGGASPDANGGIGVSGVSAGVGGNGPDTYSSWATVTSTGQSGRYAGGGSGGLEAGGTRARTAGGVGGGGAGGAGTTAPFYNAEAGLINTGGGGGGCGGQTGVIGGNSAAGGSGIVIIRYLKTLAA